MNSLLIKSKNNKGTLYHLLISSVEAKLGQAEGFSAWLSSPHVLFVKLKTLLSVFFKLNDTFLLQINDFHPRKKNLELKKATY